MDLEGRIEELRDYNVSFEIKNGYYHIALQYKDGWDVLSPDDENIYLEERNGVFHYIALTTATTINELFKVIDLTIEYNKDLEKKLLLFKEKTDELQNLFANETYNKLKTLRFVFEHTKKEKQKKTKTKDETKKKTTKKKKNIEKKIDEATQTDEDVKDTVEQPQELLVEKNEEEEVVVMDGEYFEELQR